MRRLTTAAVPRQRQKKKKEEMSFRWSHLTTGRLRYLLLAFQLLAEQLLLRGVQASLQTLHLLLQRLRGGGRHSVIKCLTVGVGVGGREKKGKSLCLCGVMRE